MSLGEAYGYAVARIKAMEHRLLDTTALQRLVDAEDVSAVLKVLGETSYASELASKPDEEQFDAALEKELLTTYSEVQSFIPEKKLVELCRVSYDFHNVKVLLKSSFNLKSGGKKRWDLLTSLGYIPINDLILAIESEDFTLLPYGLNVLLPQCISIWDQSKDIFEIEKTLDSGLFASMLRIAATLNQKGIMHWCQARIDGENLRNIIRLKRFEFEAAQSLPLMHKGGTLGLSVLTALLTEPIESWSRSLAFSEWGQVLEHMEETNDYELLIVSLEKLLDEHSLRILSRFRYSTDAPENILLYLWNKEIEVKNIRTVMVSKSIATGKEELRRLIRYGAA